jgi:hypothetical protein
VLNVIDFAPNSCAENNEFITVKSDVIIVHSSLCPVYDIGTGARARLSDVGNSATLRNSRCTRIVNAAFA